MIVALTGGIGCGKSTALRHLMQQGWDGFDADLLCRDLLQLPSVLAALNQRWGGTVCAADGQVDRKALAAKVFSDPAALEFLTSLLYPELRKKLAALQEQYGASDRTAVVEIPLLFEQHWEEQFDAVIAVWSDFEVRRERLTARGWDEAECERRERLQWTPERKLEAADFGLINQGSEAVLAKQCAIVTRRIAGCAPKR